jgi:hypothetical protein
MNSTTTRSSADHLEPETIAQEELKLETEIAQATGVFSPMSWWRLGLVALFLLAAILLAIQFLGGNKGTDVIPGTPVAAPQTTVPTPQS